MENGWFDNISMDIDRAPQILKILDAGERSLFYVKHHHHLIIIRFYLRATQVRLQRDEMSGNMKYSKLESFHVFLGDLFVYMLLSFEQNIMELIMNTLAADVLQCTFMLGVKLVNKRLYYYSLINAVDDLGHMASRSQCVNVMSKVGVFWLFSCNKDGGRGRV